MEMMMTYDGIEFERAIHAVSPELGDWCADQLNKGRTLDEVKSSIRRAMAIVGPPAPVEMES